MGFSENVPNAYAYPIKDDGLIGIFQLRPCSPVDRLNKKMIGNIPSKPSTHIIRNIRFVKDSRAVTAAPSTTEINKPDAAGYQWCETAFQDIVIQVEIHTK